MTEPLSDDSGKGAFSPLTDEELARIRRAAGSDDITTALLNTIAALKAENAELLRNLHVVMSTSGEQRAEKADQELAALKAENSKLQESWNYDHEEMGKLVEAAEQEANDLRAEVERLRNQLEVVIKDAEAVAAAIYSHHLAALQQRYDRLVEVSTDYLFLTRKVREGLAKQSSALDVELDLAAALAEEPNDE